MKFSIPVLIFSLILFASACTQDDKGKEIDLNEKELKISVGEKAFLKYEVHHSIGKNVNVEVSDENILELTGEEIIYKTKKRPIPDGGDRGHEYFYFKAKSNGVTKLKIIETLRGEVSNVIEIKVIVE